MNKLEERTQNFINILNTCYTNEFEYVKGYKGFNYPVVVKCKKCEREIEVPQANYITRGRNPKYKYKCNCLDDIDYDTLFESLVKENGNDMEYLGYKDSGKLSKFKIKVKCKKCNSIYIIAYPILKNGQANCCNKKSTMTYDTYTTRLMKEIFPRGKVRTYENIYNYKKVIEKEMKYIDVKKFDKKLLKERLLVKAKELKEKWKVEKCDCCGEIKFGVARNRIVTEITDYNICFSCYIDYKKCTKCGKTKKQNRFDYLGKGEFSEVCMRCNKKED